jgi:hypothetical protein
MGHTRLGSIPTSKPWKEVVGVFLDREFDNRSDLDPLVQDVASKTMEAASGAVASARRDGGVIQVFYLLTQIALAARRADLDGALLELGIELPVNPSSVDFTVEVHRVLDEYFLDIGRRSDVAEMAQLALGESLGIYFRQIPHDLFSSGIEQLRRDLYPMGTQQAFGNLARQFFSSFTKRLLGFYLSRIVGPSRGQQAIQSATDISRFNEQLQKHSYQRTLIVHDFSAKWFSRTEFERGINEQAARRFVSYALRKLEVEFKRGADGK